MRKPHLWIMAGLMAVSLCGAGSTAGGGNGDEEEIRALYERVAAAFRAKDVDALMQNYAPGDELFVFAGGTSYTGAGAYRQYIQNFFATAPGPVEKMEIQNLHIVAEGKLAYTRATVSLTFADGSGSGDRFNYRVTHGLRKIGGKWLIAQEHVTIALTEASMSNLLRSRKAANEASAVGSLRIINTACVVYSAAYGTGFPARLVHLGRPSTSVGPGAAALIDEVLASGTKNGYTFLFTPGKVSGGIVPSYQVQANPVTPGQTGDRYFFTDQSGVIRVNTSRPATSSDPPLS